MSTSLLLSSFPSRLCAFVFPLRYSVDKRPQLKRPRAEAGIMDHGLVRFQPMSSWPCTYIIWIQIHSIKKEERKTIQVNLWMPVSYLCKKTPPSVISTSYILSEELLRPIVWLFLPQLWISVWTSLPTTLQRLILITVLKPFHSTSLFLCR